MAVTVPGAGGDLAARRIVALARVTAALVVTALASVETIPLPAGATWAAGLLWLPLAIWAWYAEEGPASRARTTTTTVADLVVIALALSLLPEHAGTVVVLSLPIAAAIAYRSGPLIGLGWGAAVFGLAWLLADGTPETPAAMGTSLAVAIVGTVALINRALVVQRRDARTVWRQARKSDLILAQSSEGMVLTDPSGRIVQANPAAERVLGDPATGPLTGSTCHQRLGLHTDEGPLDCSRTCALAALCAGDDQGVMVHRLVGGERQPLLASAAALTGADGAEEVLHSFRDITRLRQADEAKTMFLATASHELKTPLTVIRGFTQMLQVTATDDRTRTALGAIETRTDELASIVDRLLLSSRIDAGKVDLVTDEVDVTDLLSSRLADVGSSLGRVVEVTCAPDLVAIASREALATVVDHLLDNAAKYSPGGEPISVVADRTDEVVTIDITDQGIGMTPEQAERCFDRFWQAEASDVRRFGGTGIGLYIVRSLVAAMGGQVEVTSTLGGGTTFRVALEPVGTAPEPAVEAAERTTVDEFMHQLGLPSGGK